MIKAVKIKMSQIWAGEKVVPITWLKLLPEEVSSFQVKDEVSLKGVSKGRGFAGVVKRHGFAGGPKTHGQSDRWRAPGSLGGTTTPGRVYKGKRMAGRLGSARRTLRTVVVVIDKDSQRLAVAGPVPGASGSSVWLGKAE